MRDGLHWIRSTRDLEELTPSWRTLWRTDPDATPFQSPEWLVPWWHSFGSDLRTVALFRDGKLIALLPFYLHVEPATGERRLLPLGVGTSDYLDGLFAPECSAHAIGTALDFLMDHDDWDSLYAGQLRPHSRLLLALEDWSGGQRFAGESCLRMPATTVSGLPRKIRQNAMYYRNRAQRAGKLEFDVADASNCEQMFEELVRLHTERWRVAGQTGVFGDPRMIRWHQEALPLLERSGMLRLRRLRLDGATIAVYYSLIDAPERRERAQNFICRRTPWRMPTWDQAQCLPPC
jgi:CelD/BcsL family acetyltransferase involved in cellulose biosynthesis